MDAKRAEEFIGAPDHIIALAQVRVQLLGLLKFKTEIRAAQNVGRNLCRFLTRIGRRTERRGIRTRRDWTAFGAPRGIVALAIRNTCDAGVHLLVCTEAAAGAPVVAAWRLGHLRDVLLILL